MVADAIDSGPILTMFSTIWDIDVGHLLSNNAFFGGRGVNKHGQHGIHIAMDIFIFKDSPMDLLLKSASSLSPTRGEESNAYSQRARTHVPTASCPQDAWHCPQRW